MSQCDEPDDLIAAALAAGLTNDRAAAAGGVSRATVTRRLADPSFRDRVAAFRREAIGRAVGLLSAAVADAAAQLHLIATSGEAEGNRLKASVALLDMAVRYDQHADLSERVRRLEEGQPRADRPGGEA